MSPFVFLSVNESQWIFLLKGGWESDQTSQLVVVVFQKESTEKAKCGGEEGHQHNNDILYYFRFR